MSISRATVAASPRKAIEFELSIGTTDAAAAPSPPVETSADSASAISRAPALSPPRSGCCDWL
jgi:hypothetical protein